MNRFEKTKTDGRAARSCKTAALTLLARQPYTIKKLKEKLMQKGYPHQEIEEIIEWCTEAGYLDDAAWAARAAERKADKGWDRYKITQYLRAYGVSREDARNAVENVRSAIDDADERNDGDYADD